MSRKKAVRQLRAIFAMEKLKQRDLAPTRVLKPSKEAGITRVRDFYDIHSYAVSGMTLLDPDGYRELLSIGMSDAELGTAAHTALAASRFLELNDPEWDRVKAHWNLEQAKKDEERLKARAGVKTRKALYKGAGRVILIQEDGQISIRPSRYGGGEDWYPVQAHEPANLPENVTDEELGAVIRRELDISTSAR